MPLDTSNTSRTTPATSSLWTRRHCLTGIAAAVAAMHVPAWAQRRSQPLRFVVPFAPGGGNDVFSRQMAFGLNEMFQRNIIVENKAGAGGNLGTEIVVRAAADGSSFLLGHTGTVSINPSLYQSLKFNAATDLQPVAMFASSALLLVVPESSPIKDVAQLAAALRNKSNKMNYASSGSGTGGHLTGEMFLHMLKGQATHVPYKGSGPSLTDLAGGVVDFSFSVIPAATALIRSGKLRALAITSAKRHGQYPDIPTVAEAGVPELAQFESSLTYGILAPKGTAADVVRQMSSEVLKVAGSSAFQSKLGVEGAEPMLGDAQAYAQKIGQETAKWAAVIKASGAEV